MNIIHKLKSNTNHKKLLINNDVYGYHHNNSSQTLDTHSFLSKNQLLNSANSFKNSHTKLKKIKQYLKNFASFSCACASNAL